MASRSLSKCQPSVVALVLCLLLFPVAVSDVTDVTPVDVTTRAFSVVWASDDPLTSIGLRIFADAAGTTELTGSLALVPSSSVASMAAGIAKVDVLGLQANSCYYFQTESVGAATVQSPLAPPFTEVCTATATRKATASETAIVNDLIAVDLFLQDGATASDGGLMLLEIPSVAAYPISAFIGEGVPSPGAAVDLGNLFAASNGESAELATDDVMRIRQFRGLNCPDLERHQLVQYRRVPAHDELPALGETIVELESGSACFFADTECDDTIDILDAQRVLNSFASQLGDCSFNDDLDLVTDQVINILDVQSVLNRFGESAPFN